MAIKCLSLTNESLKCTSNFYQITFKGMNELCSLSFGEKEREREREGGGGRERKRSGVILTFVDFFVTGIWRCSMLKKKQSTHG